MTETEAKKLKVGDRVVLFPGVAEYEAKGTVTQVGHNGCVFDWDDGKQNGSVIHHKDMRNAERLRA